MLAYSGSLVDTTEILNELFSLLQTGTLEVGEGERERTVRTSRYMLEVNMVLT